MKWPRTLLCIGILALSTAVVLVKLSQMPPGLTAAARLLIGAIVLTPLMLMERRRSGASRKAVTYGSVVTVALPATFLAGHFVTLFAGVRLTSVSNATLIANMMPVVMPFWLYLSMRERVNRAELVGSGLALLGLIVLAGGSVQVSLLSLNGDLLCGLSMFLAVGYLVSARRSNRRDAMFSYIVPLYLVASALCFGYSVASGELAQAAVMELDPYREGLLLLLLGVIPTAIGHSVLNVAMVYLRGQTVAVAVLGEVVLASMLAVPVLGEWPRVAFYPAAGCILLGVLAVIFGQSSRWRLVAFRPFIVRMPPPA
jgi:drug/metabolite transporter (DMT)-like permease